MIRFGKLLSKNPVSSEKRCWESIKYHEHQQKKIYTAQFVSVEKSKTRFVKWLSQVGMLGAHTKQLCKVLCQERGSTRGSRTRSNWFLIDYQQKKVHPAVHNLPDAAIGSETYQGNLYQAFGRKTFFKYLGRDANMKHSKSFSLVSTNPLCFRNPLFHQLGCGQPALMDINVFPHSSVCFDPAIHIQIKFRVASR